MATTSPCRNCGKPIYRAIAYGKWVWFHDDTKRYDCDLPYSMIAQPLPDDVTPMRRP